MPRARIAKANAQPSENGDPVPLRQSWSFAGPFGTFDQAQLQRGFKVYHDVCSACHSLNLLSFHDLAAPGGPDFPEAQVKALAATYKIKDGPNDAGEMYERPGRLSDRLPSPFPNREAACGLRRGAPRHVGSRQGA